MLHRREDRRRLELCRDERESEDHDDGGDGTSPAPLPEAAVLAERVADVGHVESDNRDEQHRRRCHVSPDELAAAEEASNEAAVRLRR